MTRYPFRSAYFPVDISLFGFVLPLLRVGVLYVFILLAFNELAWGAVPQEGDIKAQVRYNAGCSNPTYYSSLSELVDACKANILLNKCLKPGCVLNSFFVGEQYPPCTSSTNPVQSINGVPHPGRCGYGNKTAYSPPAYNTVIPSLTGTFFYFSTGLGYLCPPNSSVYLGDNHTQQNQWI